MRRNRINLKLALILILTSIYLIYRYSLPSDDYIKPLALDSKYCFNDKWLFYTSFINKFAAKHLYFRDLILIFSSNCLDILMVSFIFYYIQNGHKGECTRSIISLFMFYLARALIQNIFTFSIYDTYLFDYPGFFSFVVPFGRAPDFYYSGHCGCSFLLTVSFRDFGEKYFYFFGIFVTFMQVIVMTSITRAHYSIDVIFGIIFANYFYKISKQFLNRDDRVEKDKEISNF
jgi:hypothetical protein